MGQSVVVASNFIEDVLNQAESSKKSRDSKTSQDERESESLSKQDPSSFDLTVSSLSKSAMRRK